MDAGYDAQTICEILDIGPTVLTQWRFSFAGMGLSFFGLKDYKQRHRATCLWNKSGLRKHISLSILREVPMRWLSSRMQYIQSIKAHTTQQILETLEVKNPTMTAIHVFLDNARYHYAKVLQSWLESSERRVKLHFLPPYAGGRI